jgi:hypothetical protein
MSLKKHFEKNARNGLRVLKNGARKWYRHGQLHRIDGPAVEFPDGSVSWYFKGKLHRDGGPAIVHDNGYEAWYRHGMQMTDDQVFALLRLLRQRAEKKEKNPRLADHQPKK